MGDSHLEDASLGRVYKDLLFTQGRLVADPKTADLLGQLQPAMEAIKSAQLAENNSSDHHVLSQGKVVAIEVRAEEVLNPIYLSVQGITNNLRDNSAPLAKLMFPNGLTGAKDQTGAAMQKEVKRMHAAIKTNALAAGLSDHLRPLAELDKAFDKPLAEQAQAEAGLSLAESKSAQVRGEALVARAVLRGMLEQRFPRQTRKVASFFRKERKGKSKAAAKKKSDAAKGKDATQDGQESAPGEKLQS